MALPYYRSSVTIIERGATTIERGATIIERPRLERSPATRASQQLIKNDNRCR